MLLIWSSAATVLFTGEERMEPQAHNIHYDSIVFQNKETVLIYSWKSKVVSICAGIIIVQWLSPLILIRFTRFDAKTK